MFYRIPIYTRRVERKHGRWQYVISVPMGDGNERDVVVSESVYNTIVELAKHDRRISHQIERHNEYSELTDESLYERTFVKPRPMEDAVLDSILVEQVLSIIKTLPLIQAKRFVLRNILGLTYPEIARIEGCNARSVKNSVDLATKKIREILK